MNARSQMIRLAAARPDLRADLVKAIKAAAWDKLPKGWTDESVKKFWGSLTGDVKHKVTKCMKRMEGKMDNPGAFCAGTRDRVEGKGWRSERRAAQKTAAHHHDGQAWYADTEFINIVPHVYPGAYLRHIGFGEFVMETPDGNLEFDRMHGKDFPGQSGRSHQLYDNKGGKVAEKAIKLMEQHGKSTKVAATRHVLLADVKRKDGVVLPKGATVTLTFKGQRDDKVLVVASEGQINLPISLLPKYVSGITKAPSLSSMEKWMNDGIARTPTGYKVEPDGTGPDGSPSWLLVLGMI